MEHHWGSEVVNPLERDLPGLKLRYILPAVKKQNIRVLEIGCGNGKILRSLKKINPSCSLYGCDLREPGAICDFSFKKILSRDLPYEDDFFDIVIVMDVFEHVKEYRHYMTEIGRMLKKDGCLTGFVPAEGNPLSAYSIAKLIFGRDVMEKTKEHINSFNTLEILSLMEKHFTIANLNYSYHFIGQTMDCLLFTLMLNKKIERLFWNKNRYYNSKEESTSGLAARIFNAALTAANRIAYYESLLLKNVRAGSAGIHFICKNKKSA